MLEVTPTTTHRDDQAQVLRLALPVLLAFAGGVLATLVFAGGPLAERSEQEVAELLDELHQVRRSEAWLMTLAAQYVQATDHCEAAAAAAGGAAAALAPRVTTAGTGGAR